MSGSQISSLKKTKTQVNKPTNISEMTKSQSEI